MEAAGVHDVLSKSIGSNNAVNTVKAVFAGLDLPDEPARDRRPRGKTLKDFWG